MNKLYNVQHLWGFPGKQGTKYSRQREAAATWKEGKDKVTNTIFSTPGSHYCPVQFLKTFIGGSVDLKLTKLEDVAISVALYTMLIKLFFLCNAIPEIGTSYKCTCMSLYALAATANQLLLSVFPAVQGRTQITLISQRGCVSTSNVINRKWSITASAASYHFPNCPSQVPCAHIFLGTAFL